MIDENLAIYKVSYNLCIFVSNVIKNYQKEYKFNIGQKLFESSLEVLELVYRANADINSRVKYIKYLLLKLEKLTLLFRLSHDLKLISTDKLSESILFIDKIRVQAQGWKNNTIKKEYRSEQDYSTDNLG